MKAGIVDLRYKSKEILQALDRNETVDLLYRGKLKAKIQPWRGNVSVQKVTTHPFFCSQTDGDSVDTLMDNLRSLRY